MKPTPAGRGRVALSCALPSMLLAAILLLPFLNTPFTIDDPIFLREAQHILKDPLHPQAFDLVWTYDVWSRASKLLPGGATAAYLLTPVVLTSHPEITGHLEEILFAEIILYVTALLALRLGLEPSQARWAVLLTAVSPAFLGMASTVMPDVTAAMFVVLGMERILAWRDEGKWSQAVAASIWLALAALTRSHTALMLAPAAVFLLDGIRPPDFIRSIRTRVWRYAPLVIASALAGLILIVTADPNPGTRGLADQFATDWPLRFRNISAYFSHWVMVTPIAIPWLAMRQRQIPWVLAMTVITAAALDYIRFLHLIVIVAAVGALALADMGLEAWRSRNRDHFALFLWLLPALAPVVYLHVPNKYIVPSIPAAAILVAGLLPKPGLTARRWLMPAAATAMVVLSILVLTGIRSLAERQREAVERLIVPRVKAGERVQFLGNWGFHWYAEEAGAVAATVVDPVPQPGDVVVMSYADDPMNLHREIQRTVIEEWSELEPSGRVMDIFANTGFFSNGFGNLPWVWGTGETNRFEVWRVQ